MRLVDPTLLGHVNNMRVTVIDLLNVRHSCHEPAGDPLTKSILRMEYAIILDVSRLLPLSRSSWFVPLAKQ